MQEIAERYDREGSAWQLVRLDDSYQLITRPEYAPDVKAALAITRSATLSQAALEVLAVVSYNQPVTRSFVEQIRGVDCSAVMNSLVEKHLIEEAGRLELPGRPISYRTTDVFLRSFGLESLEQLPEIRNTAPSSSEQPESENQMTLEQI
jgi:segregation and condensation protein B